MELLAEVQRLCADFDHREIGRTEFLDRCTRLVASTIGCSRAGIWVFHGERPALRLQCLAMYDAIRDRMTQVPDEEGSPVADYFLALEQTGHVMATDARAHFATAGFFERFLEQNHVRSLLAAAFSVNGRLYGAFTCTQVGSEKEWSRPELASLRVIGSRVSLALANVERTATDTQPGFLSSL